MDARRGNMSVTRKILAICAALLVAFGAVAEGFTAISAGGAHALAVDEKGGVWAWGSNVRGESVPGSADARVTEPVKVLENVVSVACGRNFSLALTSDGALYGWGDHRSKQLPGASDAPVLLREGVLSMDACEERAVLVTETGEVYAWGAGENLHLLCENAAEAAVGVDFILVRLKTGEVYEYPDSADYSDEYEPASGAEHSADDTVADTAGGAEDSGNGDASNPAGGTEDSGNGDASDPAGGAEDSGNGDASEPAGGTEDSGNGDASEPAGGAEDSDNGDTNEPAGGAENSGNGDASEPAGGAEHSGNGDANEPAGGVENSGNGDASKPAGGAEDSGNGDASKPADGAEDSANGGAGEAVNVEDSAKNDVSKAANAEISGDGGAKSSADGADVLAEGDADGVTDTANDSGGSNLGESVVGVKKLEGATEIDACGQTRMARTEDGTLYIWGAAGTDGRLGLAVNGWVDTPMPLELADVRTFSAGLTTSGAITEGGEACLWGTVYSYVVLYDENGDPAASVVDGPLVSYGSAPVRLYDNAQALAFGDAFVLLLRSDGTILAWGSNDHGQMADGDWTKAELADGDDEEEKDVVITESDQFVFPAVIAVPAES